MKRLIQSSIIDSAWPPEFTYKEYGTYPDQLIDALDEVARSMNLTDYTEEKNGHTEHYYHFMDYDYRRPLGHVDWDEEMYELKEMYENSFDEKDFHKRIHAWLESVCKLDIDEEYEARMAYESKYF